jgi:hypothetical protein
MNAKPFLRVVHFQMMPTIKLVLPDPLTAEEQAQVGQTMRCPKSQWPCITRAASLSMPDEQICKAYVDWVETVPGSNDLPYGFIIEQKDTWLKTYTEEDLTKMKKSFLEHGHPTENWVYTYYVDTDEDPLSLNSKMMLYMLEILQYKMLNYYVLFIFNISHTVYTTHTTKAQCFAHVLFDAICKAFAA